MTWYYSCNSNTLDVYDHTNTLVRESVDIPEAWSNVPDPVYEIMADAAREAAVRGNLKYAAEVFADAIADDIEEGQP